MAADGVTKIVSAFKDKLGQARRWAIFNGIVNLLLALLIWRQGASTAAVVLGVGLGLYIMSTGWTALFAPDEGVEDANVAQVTNEHPDERLGLPPHREFGRLGVAAVERGYYYLKFSDDIRSALPPGCTLPTRMHQRTMHQRTIYRLTGSLIEGGLFFNEL
jgi:uncharacterized membrane protein